MKFIYERYKSTRFEKRFKFMKRDLKFVLPVSALIKTMSVLIGLSSFFVGALLFQGLIVGIGTPAQKDSNLQILTGANAIAGCVLGLLFGSLQLLAFGSIGIVEKKYGEVIASVAVIVLIATSLAAIASIAVGASVYVSR